jgi:hypothetical protein
MCAMTRNKRSKQLFAEPKASWQRAIAGERLPKDLCKAKSKCEGTVEDHRPIALDVRELIRAHVFDQPLGSVFRPNIAFPWMRLMRLNSSSLDLELVTGRVVSVPVVWARCGVMGERMRLQCPICGRRICTLYYLEPRLACRRCNGLWYAAQRTSSYGRRALAKRKIRRKLGDYGQSVGQVPAKAARHVATDICASLCGAGPDRAQARLLI